MTSNPPRVVLKFGGTSVSSVRGWETIAGLVRSRQAAGERILVVHSALSGVTDALELLPDEAVAARHAESLDRLEERHRELTAALGLDDPPHLSDELRELRELAEAIERTGKATASVRAHVLGFGERMSTRIGAAYLASRDIPVEWLDAGDLLTATATGRQWGDAVWLSAECDSQLDPHLQARLDAIPGVGLTQGFIAKRETGERVVLGRGGSDTAAAYLAGKWGADRLEIWSDVPGMFTADPRTVPSARLLRRLDYREAQEIATTGSQVLHPRSIRALRDRRIPIHLRSTMNPDAPHTVIESMDESGPPQVKAISRKKQVVLVSMETLGMWHEVGFLAKVFAVFQDLGLSVDLVSTSETNVTASLDPKATLLDEEMLGQLRERLSQFCGVRIIQPCAAVSLVGSRIRTILHKLGPALEAFEEHRVHLVSQAASDLNLTFVVDEDQAAELARRLHGILIPEASRSGSDVFGPSMSELSAPG